MTAALTPQTADNLALIDRELTRDPHKRWAATRS
jgi:hypothetical protein